MTLTELKALGYDTVSQIEALQGQLRQINQAIAERIKKEQPAKENANEGGTGDVVSE